MSRDTMSPMAALVRLHDRDRFQTALFAPAARREALFALYAFNYEIARVREAVREEILGRIRLQWWREAIDAAYDGGPVRRHPGVEALTAAIRAYRPSRGHFERLIEAREADLQAAEPPSLAALEAYCEASSASLVSLAAEMLGEHEAAPLAAARGVGIGYGLAGLLRGLPFLAREGRRPIPDDLMAEAGVDPADYRALRPSPPLRRAVGALATAAADHLAAARAERRAVPRAALAALLPASIASRFLVRLKRAGNNPFDPALAVPDPLQSWRLLAAALRNRF